MGDFINDVGGEGIIDFRRDAEMVKSRAKANSRVPTVNMTLDQLKDLKRVNEERIAADKLRKMGVHVKEGTMGVRYE